MRKTLLFLVVTLFMVTAPAAFAVPCTMCKLPSGNLCWADYGAACTAPATGPVAGTTGPWVVGHCTPSQASQFCPGHPSNPGAGAAPDCALCTLPSGNLCWVDYGSPCTSPPTGPVGSTTGPWIVGHCTPSQAASFCSNHTAITSGTTTTGPGSTTGGTTTGGTTGTSTPPAAPGTPEEALVVEDSAGETALDPP